MDQPEQFFIFCSLLCSVISKGGKWVASKNSNPWCSISKDRRFRGKVVLIPRIRLSLNAETLPVSLKRLQFPVRLAFAMTINKSQGQSVEHVGINLQTSVFSHGQLYMAFSRCTSRFLHH